MLWQTKSSIGLRSTRFLLLSACRFVEFDTCNLPCVYALFWLVSISSYVFKQFFSLQVFAFKGQNMKLTVKMLFTCIAGAFTMTWVWFLNLEMVKDVEGN